MKGQAKISEMLLILLFIAVFLFLISKVPELFGDFRKILAIESAEIVARDLAGLITIMRTAPGDITIIYEVPNEAVRYKVLSRSRDVYVNLYTESGLNLGQSSATTGVDYFRGWEQTRTFTLSKSKDDPTKPIPPVVPEPEEGVLGCPLPGGFILISSYNPSTETGHGSNNYWANMRALGYEQCSWALPQRSGCRGPNNPNNVCSGGNTCNYYGYAIDVFPTGINNVVAPTINGETVEWRFSGETFSNGAMGYTYSYKDSSEKYFLRLTHMKLGANTANNILSGEKIGELFPLGSNTHIHIELQVDSSFVKPEEYLCG